MSIHRTHGVVLRTRKMRESSKIVILFTRDYGKISVVARGSLKPKSKFGSSLELFTRSAIIFYKKENRDLHTLSHSEILSPYKQLKRDVVKVAYASVIGEMVERLLPAEQPNRSLYNLLTETLKQIDLANRTQLEVVLSSYELKLLRLIGYGPHLASCVRCGRQVNQGAWFGLISGGLLCRACHDRDLNSVGLSNKALELLRELEAESIASVRERHSSDQYSREVSNLLNSFVRSQVGETAKIKSLDFLERIRDVSYQ